MTCLRLSREQTPLDGDSVSFNRFNVVPYNRLNLGLPRVRTLLDPNKMH